MLDRHAIQNCIIWACEREVLSPKPGNVNSISDGHNMQVEDFIKSAHAIAPALTTPKASVGQRILYAIQATREVVDCNTNLGIVLLFAPLCVAIEQCSSIESLRETLSFVLKTLTIDDAKYCFEAIQLAEAGGLGKVEQHDINSIPTVSLLEAMEQAKSRDSIAAQYLNNYQAIFEIGLVNLTSAINSGESIEWATTFAYLYLLSDSCDTLICRKQGEETAKATSYKAKQFVNSVNKNKMLSSLSTELSVWDKELKSHAINPGTTADLTAASLFLHALSSK
ncbi:triphosphoribosyl-dephospho-CoA synthase [Pseudomonadota bacterium]|nr:triphosphoribosyl-dephospho-CoA synthase [Pseudomonadota bacterium]